MNIIQQETLPPSFWAFCFQIMRCVEVVGCYKKCRKHLFPLLLLILCHRSRQVQGMAAMEPRPRRMQTSPRGMTNPKQRTNISPAATLSTTVAPSTASPQRPRRIPTSPPGMTNPQKRTSTQPAVIVTTTMAPSAASPQPKLPRRIPTSPQGMTNPQQHTGKPPAEIVTTTMAPPAASPQPKPFVAVSTEVPLSFPPQAEGYRVASHPGMKPTTIAAATSVSQSTTTQLPMPAPETEMVTYSKTASPTTQASVFSLDASAIIFVPFPTLDIEFFFNGRDSNCDLDCVDDTFDLEGISTAMESFVDISLASRTGAEAFQAIPFKTVATPTKSGANVVIDGYAEFAGDRTEIPSSEQLQDMTVTYFSFWGSDDLENYLMENGYNRIMVQHVIIGGELVQRQEVNSVITEDIGGQPTSSDNAQVGAIIVSLTVLLLLLISAVIFVIFKSTFDNARRKELFSDKTESDVPVELIITGHICPDFVQRADKVGVGEAEREEGNMDMEEAVSSVCDNSLDDESIYTSSNVHIGPSKYLI